jgi:uncharacterized protein (TIGR01777 family)
MKVAIAGGSGFIGEAVVRDLVTQGHDVAVLTRNPQNVAIGRALVWDAKTQGPWSSDVAAADVVINLAGENIGERWTERRKVRLVESRIGATRALIAAMAASPQRSRTFISASAVGFYGPRGDEILDEDATRGGGFLADLAARWEEEARAALPIARLAILRVGVVLGRGGGALAKMLPPFKLGAGGRIGSGRQWLSWVALDDVVRAINWVITEEDVRGVFNITAPTPVTNRDFTRALGRALHRPAIVPIPAFAMRVLFGQMAEETLLQGQRVIPSRAVAEGFRFVHGTVESAIQQALRSANRH